MPIVGHNLNRKSQLSVSSIKDEMCRFLVRKHHYSGVCPGIKFSFGLYVGTVPAGCVIYSVPASYTLCKGVCGPLYKDNVVELSRLVVITKARNAASLLIGQSLKKMEDFVVVSFADCTDRVGHVGYVYQATNWLYTGHGNREPVWFHPVTREVVSYTRRHIDTKSAKYGLHWKDLVKVDQPGKHRYVTFTGNRRFKKAARAALRYQVLPYPKGETARHLIRPEYNED